jgi:hypothetical protein
MLMAPLAMTAPDSSVTVPEMMPVGVCAETLIPVKTNAGMSNIDKEIALHMSRYSLLLNRQHTAGFSKRRSLFPALYSLSRVSRSRAQRLRLRVSAASTPEDAARWLA